MVYFLHESWAFYGKCRQIYPYIDGILFVYSVPSDFNNSEPRFT